MQEVTDCRRIPKSFFEGKHLSQLFDKNHHEYVKKENSVYSNHNKHNDNFFEDDIIISDLEQSLKDIPPTGSFDIDNLHVLILKHLDSRAKLAVLHLFKKCRAEGSWPWNISKVIFVKKPNKKTTLNVLVYHH